jgi:hypothetical protein
MTPRVKSVFISIDNSCRVVDEHFGGVTVRMATFVGLEDRVWKLISFTKAVYCDGSPLEISVYVEWPPVSVTPKAGE